MREISISIHLHEDGDIWVNVTAPAGKKVRMITPDSNDADCGIEATAMELDPEDEGILYDNLD